MCFDDFEKMEIETLKTFATVLRKCFDIIG